MSVPSQKKRPYSMGGHIVRAAIACLVLTASPVFAADRQVIAFVSTTDNPSYASVVEIIQRNLNKKGFQSVLIELPKQPRTAATSPADEKREKVIDNHLAEQLLDAKPAAIITVGLRSTIFALKETTSPVVFCMVPNALDLPFMAKKHPDRSRVTGVTMDVSPHEQINWMMQLAPRVKNVAVLYSHNSKQTAESINRAGKTRGVTVSVIETQKEDFAKAIELMNNKSCDGVIMLPDSRVYNAASVQRLLLWGINEKRPVWAFSENIVKAGALAARYGDAPGLGEQMTELVEKVVKGTKGSDIDVQYPHHLEMAINERTAAMIGLPLGQQIMKATTKRYGQHP